MDGHDVRDFLTSRRAALNPALVGLVAGPRRRVPGLRRSEVADLAGISVEYYSRLERGDLKSATDDVLDALARALLLDSDERMHLFDLARTLRTARAARSAGAKAPSQTALRPGIRQTLETIDSPAMVVNLRTDVLAANAPAKALYDDLFAEESVGTTGDANYARFVFLHPRARTLYRDWDQAADEVVATLRASAGRSPHDDALDELVGALSVRSEAFSRRWAQYRVRQRSFGTKRLHHRGIGALELFYETTTFPGEPELMMMIYSAAPGSSSHDALRLLSAWAADQRSASGTSG